MVETARWAEFLPESKEKIRAKTYFVGDRIEGAVLVPVEHLARTSATSDLIVKLVSKTRIFQKELTPEEEASSLQSGKFDDEIYSVAGSHTILSDGGEGMSAFSRVSTGRLDFHEVPFSVSIQQEQANSMKVLPSVETMMYVIFGDHE